MTPFTFTNRSKSNNNFVLTEEEDKQVNELFNSGRYNTKQKAVKLLTDRGWSKNLICQKIPYDDGRVMRDQHYNQIVQKIKAGII